MTHVARSIMLAVALTIPATADAQRGCPTRHVRLEQDWLMIMADGSTFKYSESSKLRPRIGSLNMRAAKLDRRVRVGDTIPSALLGAAACNKAVSYTHLTLPTTPYV